MKLWISLFYRSRITWPARFISFCYDLFKVQNIREDTANVSIDGYRTIIFDIVIEAPALFVYIQIQHDTISRYVLTDNGFMQFERNQTIGVNFYDPSGSLTIDERNIHILTVNQFMN